METLTAIASRRSVKQFDPRHRMTRDEIHHILKHAMLSPTAFNIQHWRFVVVEDLPLRAEIRAASWMQPQITDASLFIVLCADLNAWRRRPERYWIDAPADVRAGILESMRMHYENREQLQRDEAMRSIGIAAQTLMLAATSLGYDSCPMDLGDMDSVARLVDLPADHVIGMFVAIGKRLRDPWPRTGQLSFDEVIVHDRFLNR